MNNGIIKKIYRENSLKEINKNINLLGNDRKFTYTAIEFLTFRLLTSIIIFLILIFNKNINYFIIPIIIIIYYNLIYYLFITYPIKKRIKKLDKEALVFFEILSLTLQSGRNLENSLEITCNNVDSEISKEFSRCLMEIKFGKSLLEALNSLKDRIPSETIKNIILNLTQTHILGNNIIESMNNQVDYLREKQIMDIKSEINKIPNKVSIISVLFIVPLILLIILGPFIIDLL